MVAYLRVKRTYLLSLESEEMANVMDMLRVFLLTSQIEEMVLNLKL